MARLSLFFIVLALRGTDHTDVWEKRPEGSLVRQECMKRDACFSCDVLARLIKHQSYSQGEVSATMENAIPVKADSDLAIMMYPKKVMEELEELIDNCNVVQRSMYQSDVPMHVKRFIRNHVIAFNDFLSCFVSDRIKEITWEHEWSDKMERDRDILEILFLNKRSFYPDHKKF